MRLAFSTLALPEEPVEEVAELGARCGFEAVEIRHLDGRLLDPRMPPEEARRVHRAFSSRGLAVAAVDTSLRLGDPGCLGELQPFLELAAAWGAPLVRVFGGELPEAGRQAALEAAAERLAGAARMAAAAGVAVAVETHDGFSRARDVAAVLELAGAPEAGAVWDLHHPHRSGESVEDVWRAIGARVVHVHLKDAVRAEGGWRLVQLGDGELPLVAALRTLGESGYRGWLSVEWERAWHPELAPAATALPEAVERLGHALRQAGAEQLVNKEQT